MKLHILIPLIGAVFFLACIVVVFFVGQKEPEGDVALVAETPATTTPERVEQTAVFTEEGRHASVPANAAGTAPVCDQGGSDFMADEAAMRAGDIDSLSKETVIQTLIRRTELFESASANCIRAYVTAGGFSEMERLSDAELVSEARRMAAVSDTKDASAYRARMLRSDVTWTYEGSVMRITGAGSGTQTASLVGKYWY